MDNNFVDSYTECRNGYRKTLLFQYWEVVQGMDLDELSDSELYAMVHTSHDFYNKLNNYYQKRK